MNPLDQVNGYLKALEARLRWTALSRGTATVAIAALVATVILVIAVNSYAFSEPSLRIARILLFLCLGAAIAFGLAVPLTRLNRRRAAKLAEARVPDFNERLLTFTERQRENDPFIELLAADTMVVASRAEPEQIVSRKWIFGSFSAATVAAIVLGSLVLWGPAWFGHGASLLWAGTPRAGMKSAFYEVVVAPGNKTVRKRSDQIVSAQLVGFNSPKVQLFAKFASTAKWEPVPMEPQASGFQFLFAGLPETVEYYVEAGGVRSASYKLTAIDLPSVKKIRVAYDYPKWSGLKPVVEDPGGDLRAIEGTMATLTIQTDQPLHAGVLIIDDGTRIDLTKAEGNLLTARVPITKEGMYHIAAVEKGEDVRLTEDYFIEAQKEEPPKVRIARPGRDTKVSPIEEVGVMVEADDDFGLHELVLHYSVNGGPEKTIPLLKSKGAKTAEGETLISLEDFKLAPGDMISLYAKAKDSRTEVSSDMMFLEAQPFEREYQQSQLSGGGGGMGGEQEDDNVSQRQKEIISATFNQVRERNQNQKQRDENAKFLSDMQSKLKDQASSLARRVRSRELAGSNNEFRTFTNDMEEAAKAMGEAVTRLKGANWKDAIQPEQKALQHLLRAEAMRRQIQVAFGQRGGGGGGGGAGRDLENLFDLELDVEKNQYETGQQSASSDQRARELDEALQKLEQLARRQQELAQQQRDSKQAPQTRWQQEMLRREAEELKKRMEQLAQRGQQGQQSQGQQGQQGGQQGQQGGQSGQSGQQSGQQSASGSQQDRRIREAVERLTRATDDMRRAAGQQASDPNSGGADARRAADRLSEAKDALGSMRQQESGQELDSISRRAQQLAEQQQQFQNKLRQAYGNGQSVPDPRQAAGQAQAESLAKEKQQMLGDLSRLERDMQSAVRNLAGSQRSASSKLREALGTMQQNEIKARMQAHAEWLRRGFGGYLGPREQPITDGLNQLAEQTRDAQAAVGGGKPGEQGKSGVEQALNQVERLREQLAQAAGQRGQRGQGQRGQGNQPGQQGQQGQGQQGQGQQGQGQQGQGQQGQGQQGQGQQGQGQGQGQQGQNGQGGQGQGGQGEGNQSGQGQPGMGQSGSSRGQGGGNNGREGWNRGVEGMYRSGAEVPGQGAITNPGIERAMRDSVRELSQLRQQLREESPDLERDVQEALREIQKYDPAKIEQDPLLAERIRSTILPHIEQLELQLRRKLEGADSGQVRTSAAERVPQGYADAVAEYFRKLSKGSR